MIKNKDKFISLTSITGGKATFGDNAKGKFIGKGKIGKLLKYFMMTFYM